MKKLTYLTIIFFLLIVTSSLTRVAEKTDVSKSTFEQNNCTSQFARASSCDGCHGGTGTNGPIIIIYTDGKRGPYSIPIDEGKTDVVVVSESSNTISLDQLKEYLASLNLSVLEVSNTVKNVKPAFYDIHGNNSEEILKNMQTISIESSIKQTIDIKKPIIISVNILQASQENIGLVIDMDNEKQTLVSIYDINGKLIKNEEIILEKGINNINIAIDQGLAKGPYLLKVKNNEDQICKKIMIQ